MCNIEKKCPTQGIYFFILSYDAMGYHCEKCHKRQILNKGHSHQKEGVYQGHPCSPSCLLNSRISRLIETSQVSWVLPPLSTDFSSSLWLSIYGDGELTIYSKAVHPTVRKCKCCESPFQLCLRRTQASL